LITRENAGALFSLEDKSVALVSKVTSSSAL